MNLTLQLAGDVELKFMIESLPGAAFRRVLRPALTAAAGPVTRAAKSGAPRVVGALAKSIGSKTVTFPQTQTVAVIIGPRRGAEFIVRVGKLKKHDQVPANIAHLVHDGTKPHFLSRTDTGAREEYTDKRGRKRSRAVYRRHGRMHPGARANPFIARAWQSNQSTALAIVKGQIAIRTPIEAAKLAAAGK